MILKKNITFSIISTLLISCFTVISCASKPTVEENKIEINETIINDDVQTESILNISEETLQNQESEPVEDVKSETVNDENISINLLFAGDIMAHSENYNISSFDKIWKDVKTTISEVDLAFANIESPIDTTKAPSSYPTFNMPKEYLDAVIDAGFDVFSLCNNHTNDQGLNGIQETIKTTSAVTRELEEKNHQLYFSGLKQKGETYTHNIIEKNGWKILFLPITELLNSPKNSDYINFVSPGKESRTKFIEYCKKLREENPCDLFILSVHTSEPEYTRAITDKQNDFYMNLLDAGVDILWANHAHIIKDRKFIFNAENKSQKIIMYANGNTISGQRRNPALSSQNPNGERDNTGDGLLYSLTLEKENGKIKIANAKPIFITTYINTANEYVIKKLDDEFVAYLEEVGRKDWAQYIKRRIKITNSETRDLILWQ